VKHATAETVFDDCEPASSFGTNDGGARRDRTDDLKLAKLALSQLSYGPVFALRATTRQARQDKGWHAKPKLANASEGWWVWEDSNFRPYAYQAYALTT
jgi:hypothetical protein